ncbi:Bicarbonate transport system permease protein CmpB [Stieleria neptunia]|uniref:Bicarbonate transport system permease protein CmpB n=1 Tax=Stieleria neptunia TaxID=2527979 RepID=A0A518HVP0_9BACT|nr:ABC transporter permease subunit [Stieleria neptunia]QDV44916.1 Bicarbonate transport system permease protein CmpB [Stieleria neptunia]
MNPKTWRLPRDPKWWQAKILSVVILVALLGGWQYATSRPAFDPTGKTEDELMLLEFNGDIVMNDAGDYVFNEEKTSGVPGPLLVGKKIVEELSHPFHKNGTNDHGIGHLIFYTVSRFSVGFVLASVVAILVGVVVGLNPVIFHAVNPFLQVLKPISPLAWMPLLLYTVQKPTITAILVVFMASLWPTIANTAFGLSSIDKDYLRVSRMLEFGWFRRLFTVILPAAAPAIVAGLRISFGSALVAVVPAEMLLGELGVGYLTWIEWNNLDIAGVLFAILVVGFVGFLMDALFSKLSKAASYAT